MSKKIVILGGGYCGVTVAKRFCKTLKNTDTKITIVDKNKYHTMLTELHEVAMERVDKGEIITPLCEILDTEKVEIVTDTVLKINLKESKVNLKNGDLEYDYLVVCLGSTPTFSKVKNAEKWSFTIWSLRDALKLRSKINNMFLKASSLSEQGQKELLNFSVVGASATGVEVAGELAEMAEVLSKKYRIDRKNVTINILDVVDRPLTVMTDKQSAKVTERLKKMGVNVIMSAKISEINEDSLQYQKSGKPETLNSNLTIWAAGIESVSVVKFLAPELKLDRRGRVATDKFLKAEGTENVYVGGDNLDFTFNGETVPAMVENAEQSAETIAHNITAEIRGIAEQIEYEPSLHGSMVSVGSKYAVARVGSGNKKYTLNGRLAMLLKHFVNIFFLFKFVGFRKAKSYIGSQFFNSKHRRSVFGGHLSAKLSAVLGLPLRLLLGAVWIIEAVEKIADGWLKTPQLQGFFSGAADYFNRAVSGGYDAVTSATQSLPAAAEKIFNFNILGILNPIFVKGGGDYALRVGFLPTDWFIDTVVLMSDQSQMIFQWIIIVLEIAIGVLLVVGLFGFYTNIVAILLQLMFLMTTGLYLSTWWMIFASLVLLFGSGYTFGLDYYVQPLLKCRKRGKV